MRGRWHGFTDERGMATMVAISIMVLLLVAGVFLVRASSTEGDIAYGSMWGEGSFFAADAAINVGLDTMAPSVTNSTIPATTLGSFTYSGTVNFSGATRQPGYSLGSGTGYNTSGFAFYNYNLSGTGTGPRNAQRVVDAVATYGPIAQ
jgi:hypothetical protein